MNLAPRQRRSSRSVRTAIVALTILACAPLGGDRVEVRRDLSPQGLLRASAELEARRAADPESAGVRIALGEVHYRIARDALDRTGDEAVYLARFERATDEFVTALELDPKRPEPHLFLGAMDTYRGDLDGGMRGMRNYKRLSSGGAAYSNIAEILIYQGRIDQAREWNALAARRDAPYGGVTLNAMLIAWKTGNLRMAHSNFERLAIHSPESLREINMARLPEQPQRFEDFAAYCCGSPACGPYMADACTDASLAIEERQLSKDALRREIEIDIERQRRLEKVYQGRPELEIDIEGPVETP